MPGGMAQIYNKDGAEVDNFKLNDPAKFISANYYGVLFTKGKIFSIKTGEVIHTLNGLPASDIAESKNSFKNFKYKSFYSLGKNPGNFVKVKDGNKTYKFPTSLNKHNFSVLEFVDDDGNFYVNYSAMFPISYSDSETRKPFYIHQSGLYKFDKNLNLLVGFNFIPQFIEPSTQAAFSAILDRSTKTINFIKWGK